MLESVNFCIEKSKKEENYTLAFEKEGIKKYVLSKYTPSKEAEKYLPEDKGNKQTIWIIFGFALGYVVRRLLEETEAAVQVIIIEPDKKLLEQQLQYDENKFFTTQSNIKFLVGEIDTNFKNELSAAIPDSEIDNIRTISMPIYLSYYLEYYRTVKVEIENTIMNKLVEINTGKRFGEVFTANLIKNRKYIEDSYALSELKNKFRGIPILIVSAGPSLDKNIQYIKDFKGIIIVGNRSLKPVLEQGIKPDYICAVDPQDIMYTLKGATIDSDISMITTDSASEAFIASHKGKKYFVNTHANSSSLLGVNTCKEIGMGGSVATLCLSIAYYLGGNPIVLIGQDLAYTDGKLHSQECNTSQTNTVNSSGNRVFTKGYYGEKVQTSYQFIAYLQWFEEFIRVHNNVSYINATEGGAYIEGCTNKNFKDVVKEYSGIIKPDLHQYDKKVIVKKNIEERLNELLTGLDEMTKWAYKAQLESNKLKIEYSKYKGVRLERIRKISKALDKVDKKLKGDETISDMTAIIFGALDMQAERDKENKEKLNESVQEEGLRIAKYSYNLYSNIEKACNTYKRIIEENR